MILFHLNGSIDEEGNDCNTGGVRARSVNVYSLHTTSQDGQIRIMPTDFAACCLMQL